MTKEQILKNLSQIVSLTPRGSFRFGDYQFRLDMPSPNTLQFIVGAQPRQKLLISTRSAVTRQLAEAGLRGRILTGNVSFDAQYVAHCEGDERQAVYLVRSILGSLRELEPVVELEMSGEYRLLKRAPRNFVEVEWDLNHLLEVVQTTCQAQRSPVRK